MRPESVTYVVSGDDVLVSSSEEFLAVVEERANGEGIPNEYGVRNVGLKGGGRGDVWGLVMKARVEAVVDLIKSIE